MKGMKRGLLTFILATLGALCLFLAACDGGKIKFSFETNGGTAIEAATVEKGENFTLPTPEREGYSFEGWFDNASFNGNAVTSVVAESSKKFYAKWEQMYAITLELGGGTLPASTYYLKAGANVYDFVKDLAPTKTGWQFGAWYLGDAELPHNTVMTTAGITLSARYKVGYTIEVYQQNLAQTGYDKGENIVGYAYITDAQFTPEIDVTGFSLTPTAKADEIRSKKLTETMSENVFRVYLDRDVQRVIFNPNYPEGKAGEAKSLEALYGAELELPDGEFSADGYFITGWGVSGTEEVGEETYVSHYIERIAENGDDIEPDTITVTEPLVLYAVWSKGYTDMFRGVDRIYLIGDDPTACYLEREGRYFKGIYNATTGTFEIEPPDADAFLMGKLKADGTFVYSMPNRADIVATCYTVGLIHPTQRVMLDSYDGITYIEQSLTGGTSSTSTGSYTRDDEGNFVATFTDGIFAGQTITLRVFLASVDGQLNYLYQIRDDEEYNMDTLFCGVVASGRLTYYINDMYAIDLDGYGNATYNTGSRQTNYYYLRDGETLTLLTSSGAEYGVYRLIEIEGHDAYVEYDETLDGEFTDGSGATLTLDGAYNATYRNGDTTAKGLYNTMTSIFGDPIVAFSAGDETYVFTVSRTQTNPEEEDAPATYRYSFVKRPAAYGEYYYTDGSQRYYTPFIVMNETTENTASVYGYTSKGEFKKVAEGAVVYNEETHTYSWTAATNNPIPYPDDIYDTPVDLHNVQNIVFGLGMMSSSTASYPVSYWYSMTKNGETTPTDYTVKYTGTYPATDGKPAKAATLTLVNGFAVLAIEGEETAFGGYSTSNNVTTLVVTAGGTQYTYRIELNDSGTEKTFVFLRGFIGSASELKTDRTVDSNVTLVGDGKGNVELVTVTPAHDGVEQTETRVQGTLTELETDTAFGSMIYRFTANAPSTLTFDFLLLTSTSGTRRTTSFSRLTAVAGEYDEVDKLGKLTLDGFCYQAEYIDDDGTRYFGNYYSPEENVIQFVSEDGDSFCFDLGAGKTFTVRDGWHGSYLFITNQTFDSYVLELDGYGAAKLYHTEVPDEAEDQPGEGGTQSGTAVRRLVGEGTYVKGEDTFTLTFLEGDKAGIYIGSINTVQISGYSGSYRAFLVEDKGLRNTFLNVDDWTIITLNGYGSAIRYNQYGSAERGRYTVISNNLFYYVNSTSTDAGVYSYNTVNGTVKHKTLPSTAYYTQNLDALLFSPYGYMIFNNADQYFYDIDDDGNVTIYLRDVDNAKANEFGFVSIAIGKLDEHKNFHDYDDAFVDAEYSLASGYEITFKREAATKDDYPVQVGSGDAQRSAPLADLMFAPAGGEEYNVAAHVTIDGTNYSGRVYREVVDNGDGTKTARLYFLYQSTLRFDINVTYNGEDNATYSITQLRRIVPVQSNLFINTYTLLYSMLGSTANTLRDSIGAIEIVTEYGTDGKSGDTYINADFGEDSILYGYRLEKVAYVYDEDAQEYIVDLPEKAFEIDSEGKQVPATPDEYSYKLHFQLSYNVYYYSVFRGNVVGYDCTLTRAETLQTTIDGQAATVIAERVVASDLTVNAVGSHYTASIKIGESEVKRSDFFEFDNKLYFISREREQITDESGAVSYGKVISSTYYTLAYTEEEGSVAGETLKKLESVTVQKYSATVYNNDSGASGEILEVVAGIGENGEDAIVAFTHLHTKYFVTKCTYDAATKTYTVETSSLRKYAITVTDETEKTVTVKAIVEQS